MKVIAPPLVHGGARGAGLTMLLNQVGVNAAGMSNSRARRSSAGSVR